MKTIKKGFTLIELIIVMAIMSILMVAILSLSTPAQRMARKTNINESTYAMTDNISQTIQRTLEFADYAWVTTDDSDISKTVVDFKNCYYNNIVIPKTSGTPDKSKITVHVLKLSNSEHGKIYLSTYELYSGENSPDLKKTEELLNPAYFTGENEKYIISYALNAGEIVVDSALPRTDKDDPRYRLVSEPSTVSSGSTNQSMSIIISSREQDDEINISNAAQKILVGPANITVASLPFTNINSPSRENKVKPRYVWEDNTLKTQTGATKEENKFVCPTEMGKGPGESPSAFFNFKSVADPSNPDKNAVSVTEDIYYIFSYADEIDNQS